MDRSRLPLLFLILLCLPLSIRARAESAPVLQFLTDPFNANQAWMLSEPDLQYSPSLKEHTKWEIRFNRKIFEKVARTDAGDGYRHLKMALSSTHPGLVSLLVEAGSSSERHRFLARSNDYGKNWSVQALAGRVVAKAPPAETKTAKPLPSVTRTPVGEESSPSGSNSGSASGLEEHFGKGLGLSPYFKAYFDFLLQYRPEASPLTFDTYHTLFLAELKPRPDVQLSFEINPNPRFFEVAYEASPRLTLRAGRIWIPFDQLNPHNFFGGYLNISQLRQPAGSAFLPDFWADLGVDAHYQWIRGPRFTLSTDFYIVNGFTDGGENPGKEATYPDFSKTPLIDNNNDKAVGLRVEGKTRSIGVGLSAYEGRYTPDRTPDRRLAMVGLDAQWEPWSGTRLRAGYVLMKVQAGSGTTGRIGSYGELEQALGGGWYFSVRGGTTDNDTRVLNADDQQILGLRVGYQRDWFRAGFIHHQDLFRTPGKGNFSFTALDFTLLL